MANFEEFQVLFYLFGISSVLSVNQDAVSPAVNQLNSWAISHPNGSQPYSTNLGGVPIPSMTASQAMGSSGPVLLQDAFLLDKTASFNRERIPERVVHAKGAGAIGHFVVTHDISHITKASFLDQIGKRTPVVVRFSTVGGESGSADTLIDPKGFAVKFFTEEGNYDLVGNNIEVFPIRDPMLFSDLNRSRKRNPRTHLRDPTMWWDFVTLRPETTLHTLHLFSDIGTPMGFRGMNGAGVHTFKMVNASGAPVYVKFHWISNQEKKTFTKEQSISMLAINPDYAIQDLYDAIERKEFPSWNLAIQVMKFEQVNEHPLNPFDVTKHWRREEYPLISVGVMTLGQNHQDYFTGVEQVAFSPSNMVPGIEPSPDRMLHARMFSYPDAQRYRLGVNFAQLPVNRPISPVTTYVRDGTGCSGSNGEGGPNYYPNSYNGFMQNPLVQQSIFSLSGDVDRTDTGEADNFSQAKLFLERDVDPKQRQRIVDNIAYFLKMADVGVHDRFLRNNAYPISKEFGDMMKDALYRSTKMKNSNVYADNLPYTFNDQSSSSAAPLAPQPFNNQAYPSGGAVPQPFNNQAFPSGGAVNNVNPPSSAASLVNPADDVELKNELARKLQQNMQILAKLNAPFTKEAPKLVSAIPTAATGQADPDYRW